MKGAAVGTKFLVVDSGKGGIGKTTFSQNLAYLLASLGRQVALIDTDRQAMSSNLLDVDAIPKEKWHTITDVIRENVPLLDAMYQARPGLFIVPSSTNIETAAKHILVEEAQEVMVERIDALLDSLAPIPNRALPWQQQKDIKIRDFPLLPRVTGMDVVASPQFLDYIIFDFGGDPGALGRAIRRIGFSHDLEIWAPVCLEFMPMQGFAQMVLTVQEMFTAKKKPVPPIHIVPFKVNHRRAELTTKYLLELYFYYPDTTMRSVHDDGAVPKSQEEFPAQTVIEFGRSSRPAKELLELALAVEGYTGHLEGSANCDICQEVRQEAQRRRAAQATQRKG